MSSLLNYPSARIALSEVDLVRSITRDSFYAFVQEFWDVIIPETPVWNWHIQLLCDELQSLADRVFERYPKEYDLIINVPPGCTKSTIASVMFPVWVWTQMPTARSICGSHAFDLGMDLSRKSRDLVRETERLNGRPSYQDCFPEIELRDDQNTKGYFANTQGGMRKSVTVGGKSPVGFHAHFLIVDDPIDPQKATSEVEIKKANDWMNETLPSRKVDKAITPTILIMQRLHQDDPSGNRLAKKTEKVKHICLPADCTEYPVKPAKLHKYYKKGLMDPVRMPPSVLRQERTMLGEYGYSGQYGQSPVPLGGGMFKVERLVIDTPPIPQHFRRIIRFWDKAGTADGGAYTVGVKLGEDIHGRFWVLNVVRGQWESHRREEVIRQTAELDGKKTIVGLEQEPGSGGKESAQSTVRNLAGFRVRVDRPTGDKALRADPFSTQVNAGNVSVAKAEWNEEYIEELRYFPASRYKDQVDASSGGFNILTSMKRAIGAFR